MSIEDRLAIQDVISAYSYHWDSQDIEGWLSNVFTEDAVWEAQAANSSEPEMHLVGHPAMRDFATARIARRKGKFWSRHFQTNTVFDHLDANSARTRTMVFVSHQGVDDDAPVPMLSGVYFDHFVRTPKGWRMKHRLVRHDRHSPHVTKT